MIKIMHILCEIIMKTYSIMGKLTSLLTYFIVFLTIVWGIYYILLFFGYEQGIVFLQVYTIYYIMLFITIFFAIIFNSYMTPEDCKNTVTNDPDTPGIEGFNSSGLSDTIASEPDATISSDADVSDTIPSDTIASDAITSDTIASEPGTTISSDADVSDTNPSDTIVGDVDASDQDDRDR